MRGALVAICAICALWAGASLAQVPPGLQPGVAGGPTPVRVATVNVNLSSLGRTIPSNFVSFSINTSSLINGYLGASSTSLCSLMGMIGPNGIVRIGGLDQDLTGTAPALTTGLASGFASFLSCLGSGWTSIYGLDGVLNSPSVAATQAGILATALGVTKVTFQFTNEPIDGSNYTVTTFQTMWNSYASAVKTAVPGAQLAAWDDGNFGLTQTAINGLTGGLTGLTYVTQHWYPFCSPSGKNAAQLLGSIPLGAASTVGGSAGLLVNDTWAGASSIPQVLTESNSLCSGGQSGFSDRMMAATWYLNEAMLFASHGWAAIMNHNNFWWPASGGAPIIGATTPNIYCSLCLQNDGGFSPGPAFYGLYLFSKIEGQQIAQTSLSGNANVNVLATKGGGGDANILVVNNDVNGPVTVIPAQSSAWTTANVLQVSTSDGLECTSSNPIVGGQPIGEGGTWTGSNYSISNGGIVSLGPCESALIQIQP